VSDDRSAVRFRLVAALVGVVGLAHAVLYDAPFEDAFITYRYSEHLAHGLGLTYNPGEVVEGFTSFGWTMLLAGLAWVGLPIVFVSRALSLVAAMALLWCTSRFARLALRRERHDLWTLAPALLLAADGTWAFYAMTGMETTLFALLVACAGLVACRDDGATTPAALASARPLADAVRVALLLAAAAIVRPEGAGYFVAITAALLLDARGRRAAPAMLAAFVVVFVPVFAWRWHHFGWPAPNTYYAKASPSGAVFAAGASAVEAYFTAHLFWLVPVALAYVARDASDERSRWRPSRAWRVSTFVLFAAVANSVAVGEDTFLFHRFLLPAIPFGAVALTWALAKLASRTHAGGTPVPVRAALFGACAVVLAFGTFAVELFPLATFTTARQRKSDYARFEDVRAIDDDYFLVGDWLRRAFPGSTTLATNAAGIIPFVSGFPTIDMLGLNDVHIAHLPIVLGRGTAGHEKHDAAYVLSRKPDVILLGLPLLMKRPLLQGELETAVARWFPFLPGDRDLFTDPTFRRDYEPHGVRVTEHGYALLFVRIDSPAAATFR
jgi:hypothetical protein